MKMDQPPLALCVLSSSLSVRNAQVWQHLGELVVIFTKLSNCRYRYGWWKTWGVIGNMFAVK